MTKVRLFLIITALLGALDALYLTIEHYSGVIPPCGVPSFFSNCGSVLTSQYATIVGVPVALIGLLYYTVEFIVLLQTQHKWARKVAVVLGAGGFLASLGFVGIMLFIIRAICWYCILSAGLSTLLFVGTQIFFWRERKIVIAAVFGFLYQHIGKKLLFQFDPEQIHVFMVKMGAMIGTIPFIRGLFAYMFQLRDSRLHQKLAGIDFPNPVGLAAGYDYEANLTNSLAMMGFGFQSVGTITNSAYGGNKRPMLGRLPISRSLMVNKGYKNFGAVSTAQKLSHKQFFIPVGISVGVTNSEKMNSLEIAIADIKQTFQTFEHSSVNHAYYELNISCPNLKVGVSFYPPKDLARLLTMVDSLKLKRPVFIKMPIEKSDSEYKAMLDVILKHKIPGVIIGNLAKDRNNPAIDRSEVNTYSVGNFSGKPTWESSNHLIAFTRSYVKRKLIIIGCGGVFSPDDALEKLRLGADMIQLITGMIFQGPQLIGQINERVLQEMETTKVSSIQELKSAL